jgi:hypothetical protein
MGERFFLTWFGKSVTELKAILETNKELTEAERAELKKLIDEKEKESK